MIDKEKKYTISEVSKLTGYETHVLRYYEDDFNLQIPRSNSNRRYYTDKEVEMFVYIKELQEKGLTNKQIKLILESPELVISPMNEVAITSSQELSISEDNHNTEFIKIICTNINDSIKANLSCKLEETKDDIINYFDSYVKERESVEGSEPIRKEKDILICENARLKMKLKEKSYEVAELKEKLTRMDQKKLPFWKKVFSKSK